MNQRTPDRFRSRAESGGALLLRGGGVGLAVLAIWFQLLFQLLGPASVAHADPLSVDLSVHCGPTGADAAEHGPAHPPDTAFGHCPLCFAGVSPALVPERLGVPQPSGLFSITDASFSGDLVVVRHAAYDRAPARAPPFFC